jgi:hypothetical protein
VELRLHHCCKLGSTLKVCSVFKKAEALPEFRALHVPLSIGGHTKLANFQTPDILDDLTYNGTLGRITYTVLNHPMLLVRHEVGDCFLGLFQMSTASIDRHVIGTRVDFVVSLHLKPPADDLRSEGEKLLL